MIDDPQDLLVIVLSPGRHRGIDRIDGIDGLDGDGATRALGVGYEVDGAGAFL